MDDAVAVRDVMDRSYVGVSEGDTVAGAAGLMDEDGADCAVVLRGNEPVGLLRAEDIVSLVARGADAESETVDVTMSDRIITIEADAPVADAVDAISGDGVRRAVVTENGTVAGVLSDHDIVSTHAILPDAGAPDETQALRDSSTDRGGGGSQGVCEICGSLTHELMDHNGQLVCSNCLPA